MRKLIPLAALVAALSLVPTAHAQTPGDPWTDPPTLAAGTCEPDAIPPFSCNFNCFHATISGSRAERPMYTCGPNGNELCPEETTPIEHTYAVTRNGLCGSCGAGGTEMCGYSMQPEVLQCLDYFVRHGVPVPKGNPRQRVDVYPYLRGWVIGPEPPPHGRE